MSDTADLVNAPLATEAEVAASAETLQNTLDVLIQKRSDALKVVEGINAALDQIAAKARGLKVAKRGRPAGKKTEGNTPAGPRGFITGKITEVLTAHPEGMHNKAITAALKEHQISNTKVLGALQGMIKSGKVIKTGERKEASYRLA